MVHTLLAVVLSLATANAWTGDNCKKFSEIYTGGEDLITRMWGNSFTYETNEDQAYTMWWNEGGAAGTSDALADPNNAITENLGMTVPDQCHLSYYHKEAPTPEDSSFTECHPWHANACCEQSVVSSPVAINTAYGAGYEWDRCGPMSQACERFFVQEACMYECEVNAGLFRRFTDAQHAACSAEGVEVGATVTLADGASYNCTNELDSNAENQWEILAMPIKASYADSFYRACANDFFCEEGSFWTCKALYHEYLQTVADAKIAEDAALVAREAAAEKALEDEQDKGLEPWAIALIVILGTLGVVFCVGLLFLVSREKAGKPMFSELAGATNSAPPATAEVAMSKA